MDEAEPKKMVSRNVAIALGIACIILVAGLGITIGYYTIAIKNKDNQFESDEAQLNATIAGLQSQVYNLTGIADMVYYADWATVSLNNSGSWSMYAYANYAGFVTVVSTSASPSNMSVTLSWTRNGINYNNTEYNYWTINGSADTVSWFPVLPSNVSISITILSASTTVPIDITYGY